MSEIKEMADLVAFEQRLNGEIAKYTINFVFMKVVTQALIRILLHLGYR